MLTDLLRDVQKETATRGIACPSFPIAYLIEALLQVHYTGKLEMHFRNGQIMQCDVPNPIVIRVD